MKTAVGKTIEKMTKKEFVCLTHVTDMASKINKKHRIKPGYVTREFSRFWQFLNGWANDSNYIIYGNIPSQDKGKVPKHFGGKETLSEEQIRLWMRGYHQACSDIMERYNKLFLLYTAFEEQRTPSRESN